MLRGLLVVLLWLGLAAPAVAEDPQPPAPSAPARLPNPAPVAKPTPALTVDQAADAVLVAARANDGAALTALASEDEPDPWLVADEMIRRGDVDAADAFAKASPRVDVEALPRYVASRRGLADDPVLRGALRAANAALTARNAKEALAAIDAVRPDTTTVVGVRLSIGRGLALALAGMGGPAEDAFHEAGEAARALGWLRRLADALSQEGQSAYERREYGKAIVPTEARRALQERRGDLAGVAGALTSIGGMHINLYQYPEALSYFQRALEIRQKVGDPPWIARALGDVGSCYARMDKPTEALDYRARSLEISRSIADRSAIATTLSEMAMLYQRTGGVSKAASFAEEANRTLGQLADRLVAAVALDQMGRTYAAGRETGMAISSYMLALSTAQEVGQEDLIARVLEDLGRTHANRGEYPMSLSTLNRALKIREGRGERPQIASITATLGVVYYMSGDLRPALTAQTRALGLYEEMGSRPGTAAALMNIGVIEDSLGEYPKAIAAHDRALEIHRALGDRRSEAMVLGYLGAIYHSVGDNRKAIVAHEEAARIHEEIGDRSGLATDLLNVGVVRNSLGERKEAIEFERRALAIMEAEGDRAGAAHALLSIGMAESNLGSREEGLVHVERALKISRELGDRLEIADALRTAGELRQNLGRHREALEAFAEGLAGAEASGKLDTQVENLAGAARSHFGLGEYREAVRIAREAISRMRGLLGGLAEEQAASVRGRNSHVYDTGFAAAVNLHDVAEAGYFLESGRAGSLLESLEARGALRKATLPGPLLAAESAARARVTAAAAALDRAAREGNEKDTALRRVDLEAARAAVQDVVERIQREAKAAAQVIYPSAATLDEIRAALRPGEALVLYELLDPEGVALVVTPGDARIVALGPLKAIQAAAAAFNSEYEGSSAEQTLEALRRLLVDPLGLGSDVRRLLVSPDGILVYVPFGPLAGGREVATVPSGTTYIVLSAERSKRGESVLALGDPEQGPETAPQGIDLARTGPARAPLPNSREEARAVGDVVLVGKDASETGLKEALAKRARWRAVHFACHGIVDRDRPTLSALVLAPKGDDDGYFTLLEVFRASVPADLVVLSACETAKGAVYEGEGIVGLVRGFMFAGAPRVLASLWKVDDRATMLLMKKFYELWNKQGVGAAEALRQAQEFIREYEEEAVDPEASRQAGHDVRTKRKPYAAARYWAAWVLWGLAD